MFRSISWIVVVAALYAGCHPASADEAADKSKRVAGEFIRAIKARDLGAVMKTTAVPWYDAYSEKVIRDQAELKRYWTDKLRDFDFAGIEIEHVEAESLAEFRRPIETGDADRDKFENERHSAIVRDLEQVETAWIVRLFDDDEWARSVLVRLRDGKAEVVGGPLGCAFLQYRFLIPRAAREILEKAERIELISLDPLRREENQPDGLGPWLTLGKTVVGDDAIRKQLVAAFEQGIEEQGCAFAGCFSPRHGIRATHDGKTVQFIVCFECKSVLYEVGELDGKLQISHFPEALFDRVLRAAGVPLAKKAK